MAGWLGVILLELPWTPQLQDGRLKHSGGSAPVGEARSVAERPLPGLLPELWIEEVSECLRQGLYISRRDQVGRTPGVVRLRRDRTGDGPPGGRNHGEPPRQRLGQDHAEPLVVRWKHENRGPVVVGLEAGLRDLTGQVHPVREPQVPDALRYLTGKLRSPVEAPHEVEDPGLGAPFLKAGQRLDQNVMPLPRHHRRDA